MSDGLILCPVCRDREIPSSWGKCSACREQDFYDNNDPEPESLLTPTQATLLEVAASTLATGFDQFRSVAAQTEHLPDEDRPMLLLLHHASNPNAIITKFSGSPIGWAAMLADAGEQCAEIRMAILGAATILR